MEIEKKFTVTRLPEKLEQYPVRLIEQAYLNIDPVIRVRRQDDEYYMTYKGSGLFAREEYNLPLNEQSYRNLRSKAEGNVIAKRRYLIPCRDGKHMVELDVFEAPFAPLVIAEVEFETEEEAEQYIPEEWFAEEVTYDPQYHNSNLSRRQFS
ncbi:MAG: CYTH domain-containing protein [Lachnospiraceae bacterium]|nr:CYTH domain-containing protein [Lachnospiraceae bacterium]